MGFFSNIKNRARQQVAPVMPNPGNIGGNLGSDFRAPQKPSGLGGLLPQQNLDFLNKLPKNMMPNLDFSNLPQNMRPGFVAGGPIMGAAGKFARSKAAAQRGTNKYFPDEFGNLPPTGIPSLRPGNLQSMHTSSLPDRLRRGTENLIMGGTGAGVLLGLDGTQELREPFSKDNISFMSPEAFGKIWLN
jgi:hypothetical protein